MIHSKQSRYCSFIFVKCSQHVQWDTIIFYFICSVQLNKFLSSLVMYKNFAAYGLKCECLYTFTNILFKNPMAAVYKYKFQWTKFTTYNLKLPPDNITDIDKVLYVVTSNLSVIKLNIQKMFQCNLSFANSQKEKFARKWPPKSFYG